MELLFNTQDEVNRMEVYNEYLRKIPELLNRIKKQCEVRSADIQEQCRLIFELKEQIEKESSVLQALLP